MEQKEKQFNKDVKVLDLSGLMCPLPIVNMSNYIKNLKPGDIVEVIATDSGFEKDVWNWCKSSGNVLLELRKENDKTIAKIKKEDNTKEPSLIYWIKFHSLGVKLHTTMFFIKLNPFIRKPKYFITFSAISEGLRAKEVLKNDKDFVLLPIPNKIDPHCGVVLATHSREKARDIFNKLKLEGFGVEAVYELTNKEYVLLKNL